MFIDADTERLLRALRPELTPPLFHPLSQADQIRLKAGVLEQEYLGRLARAKAAQANRPPKQRYTLDGPPIPGQQSFMFSGVIATPANNGVDTTVLNQRVPDGFVGTIDGISNNYTGPGFVQGSGDLTWRILIDGRAVKNYQAITVENGSSQQRLHIAGIPLEPGRVFSYVVNNAVTSAIPTVGTFIICFFGGAFWPGG